MKFFIVKVSFCLALFFVLLFPSSSLADIKIEFTSDNGQPQHELLISDSNINVRRYYYGGYEVIDTLKKDEPFYIIGFDSEKGAYEIEYTRNETHCYGYVYKPRSHSFYNYDLKYCLRSMEMLSSTQGININTIKELSQGESVKHISSKGIWAFIESGGNKGFVEKKFLTNNQANCYKQTGLSDLVGNSIIRSFSYSNKCTDWLPVEAARADVIPARMNGYLSYKIKTSKNTSISVTQYIFSSEDNALHARKLIETYVQYATDTIYNYFCMDNEIIFICYDTMLAKDSDGIKYARIYENIMQEYGNEIELSI